MKLKQQPEDFQVEEMTARAPTGQGPFAFYRLEKRGWTTPDALQAIRRRWQIDQRRLSYGGLKDRHALTVQYLTIYRGPQRNLTHQGIFVQYLGQVPAPYTSRDIQANRFRILLRGLTPDEAERTRQTVEEVRREGVPNYFDDQRFGSVGESGEYVARLLVLERYEEALQLALAAPYAYDRAAQKQEKEILRTYWGDWAACKAKLPRGHARSLVDYLVHHPADFRGAAARLRPELRGLYLSAYQSHLWNRLLARWLIDHCRPEQVLPIRTRMGELPMHRGLDEAQRAELASLQLPLPSARLRMEPCDPRAGLVDAVMADEGLALREMKIRAFREPFFSKGERAALCLPAQLTDGIDADERHPGRQMLRLAFELPRGSYATLIVKRLQQGHQPEA
jgi:tRNA pseudouridine13 synthase